MSRIALQDWQPDTFGLMNKGMADARNVFATGAGYAPVKALTTLSTTGLSGQAIGAFSAQDSTGTTNTFAGDASKLYKLSGAAFSDVSKSGGYSVSGTERWEFAQFGQRVIATQPGAPPQYYDLGSSSVFADLAGSPPQARHIAVVRDFVVLGNDTSNPANVTWSGFNNSANWTPGVNQSDAQLLQGGGWVQAIIGGDVGYIFQERAITRMTYVGPPAYFQFEPLELNRGLATPGAIIRVGSVVYFYSQDGFYMKDGDSPSVSIGNQKVDNWFSQHLQTNTFSLITCGSDPANKLVLWSFVSTDATDATHPDTALIYNWQKQQWSYAKFDHEMLYPGLSEGWTLETISAAYSSLESVPVSFDSRVWTGGTPYLAAFDTTHNLANFGGDNLAAIVQTGDFEGVEGRRSLVTNFCPLTDASAMTAVCLSRERFADPLVSTTSSSMQSNGDIPLMSSGSFHQAQLSIPAGATWTYANGLDVDAQLDGDL